MSNSLRTFIVGFMLASLFTIAMIQFGVQFANDNNTNISIADSENIQALNLSLFEDLENAEDTSAGQRTAFEENDPQVESNILTEAIVFSKTVFTGVFFGMFNVIFAFSSEILGVPPIVMGTIIAILGLVLVFLGWRLIRTGE